MEGRRDMRHRLARLVEPAVPWGIALLAAATALEPRGGARQLAGLALAAVMGGALVWRTRRPELVTAVVLVASVPYLFLVPDLVIPVAGLAAIWSLTLARPPRVSLIGLAALLAVSALNVFTANAEDAVFTMGLAFTVWGLAEAARHRVDDAHAAERQAAADEKARIARELHDVIAHSVSVIVVQAGAAGDVFDTHPDQARTALQAIESTGREALTELRRLLGAVVPREPQSPSAPQPGLGRLDELAGQVRAAGLDVSVTVDGLPPALPAGIDLSAYRIVQEALTNTLRHARARSVEVTIRGRSGAVEIDVVDDGRPPRTSDGAGFGIIGMRERATVLGGTLEAGPTAHGGFRVHALLPLDPADAAHADLATAPVGAEGGAP
ncbi:MAG TPA: sensor histidine kinase [Acidimicrobiales bacterium]|nr:sensor histidine kinase [Acidimicrobiales bacterium]